MKDAKTPPMTPPDAKPDERPVTAAVKETGGRKGPEPTRYGDWELKGKCVDF
jgi:hypothetical protein